MDKPVPPASLEALRQTVLALYPLPEPVWQEFAGIFRPFEARRKAILTAGGDVERYLYFVTEGVQRAYYVHAADGREATLVFTYPYSFAGVADSFLLQTPSRYFFETLTPSVFLRASFADLDALMLRHHSIERCMRMAVSHALAGLLVRQIELQGFTSEEKFRALMKRSPHVLTMIPHKYLANYIGVDATNFSKLLNSIRL